MAAKLPSFSDLGFNDPRVTTPVPNYPASDPAAAALGTFGQGVQQLGGAALNVAGDLEDKRQKLNEATADTNFAAQFIDTHTQISLATDPAKIAQLRQRYTDMVDSASQTIDNPYRQKLWAAAKTKTVLQANADADERLTILQRQNYGVGIERQLDGLVENATQSSDPKALAVAKMAGGQLIDAAGKFGLNPEWVYQRQKQFEHKLDAATQRAAGDALANYALGLGPEPKGGGGAPGSVDRFLDLTEKTESRGRNVEQQVVGPGGGYNPSVGRVTGPSTASGNFQITDSTWGEFAPQAGVDLAKYPRAISAPYDVQRAVARTIATTSGVQHWTDYNKELRAAAANEGLPVSGPLSGGPSAPENTVLANDEAQPNRTGLPPLAEQLRRINAANSPDAVKEHAWRAAKDRYTAMEADAARSERIAAQQQRAQDESIEGEIIADAASPTPKWTAQGVMTDARLSPAARTRMLSFLSSVSRESGDHDSNTYGGGFIDAFQAIHLPDGDPKKITAPEQLYNRVGPNGDLTVAGLDKLRGEIMSKRTPEGEAAAELKKRFFEVAKSKLSYAVPELHIPDAKGDELMLKFSARFFPAYQAGLKAGKTPEQLLDPESKDSLLGIVTGLKRSREQEVQDQLSDTNAAKGSKNPADYRTPEALVKAVQDGVVPYDAGVAEATRRGYIPAPPQAPMR